MFYTDKGREKRGLFYANKGQEKRKLRRGASLLVEALGDRICPSAYYWDGSDNTSFTDVDNWTVSGSTPMVTPGSGDGVYFNNNSQRDCIISGTENVDHIYSTDTFTRNFTINGKLTVDGGVGYWYGGNLEVGNTLLIEDSGALYYRGGDITGAGAIYLYRDGYLSINSLSTSTVSVANIYVGQDDLGAFDDTHKGVLRVYTDMAVDNIVVGGEVMGLYGGGGIMTVYSGSLYGTRITNYGIMELDGTSSFYMEVDNYNYMTFKSGSDTYFYGSINEDYDLWNNGVIDATYCDITVEEFLDNVGGRINIDTTRVDLHGSLYNDSGVIFVDSSTGISGSFYVYADLTCSGSSEMYVKISHFGAVYSCSKIFIGGTLNAVGTAGLDSTSDYQSGSSHYTMFEFNDRTGSFSYIPILNWGFNYSTTEYWVF
jgi:hypothetical protein